MSEKAKTNVKDSQSAEKKPRYLSLRWKVLIGFTVIFTVVYFIALSVFTDMAIQAADGQIQNDLTQTMEGIASTLDVEKLLSLGETGENNEDGFSDDPRFLELIEFLDNYKQVEPDAWPYLYVSFDRYLETRNLVCEDEYDRTVYEEKGKDYPCDVPEKHIVALVDLWSKPEYDPDFSFSFLDLYASNSGFIVKGLNEQTYRAVDHPFVQNIKNYADSIAEDKPGMAESLESFGDWLTEIGLFPKREFGTYQDEFDRWASGYMPIMDESGNPVAAVGVDFKADTVIAVRDLVRSRVQRIFLIAFPLLLGLMAVATTVITGPLVSLTRAAERVGEGDYDVDFTNLTSDRVQDEIDVLAGVFDVMVDKVYKREQTLKRKVAQLQIEIDETKKDEEISEITDSEFFRDLQARASNLRKNRSSGPSSEE